MQCPDLSLSLVRVCRIESRRAGARQFRRRS
jgi:hypothetical protein